ncbi:MAG: DUF86 domain-containing protein [Chloroflexi bacterium]|nr:DUF86 domain-containing protein [Chloroflexota bacterium]
MLRPEVVRKRLQKLEEYLNILERLGCYTLEEFLVNPERYGSAERFLQLAIEAIDDVAAHVVAELELGPVEARRDLARHLREHSYIDEDLEQRWMRVIGFRNILVHDYLEIDRKLVYRVLKENLVDLRALAAVFSRFL